MTAPAPILVTGASGFIGGRLVAALSARGERVRVATSSPKAFAQADVEIAPVALNDPDSFARAAEGCRVVFHAGYAFGRGMAERNVAAARALAQGALLNRAERFVQFSSMVVYGPPSEGALDERAPTLARDDYARAKLAIENMLLDLHQENALPATILQPSIVYGPGGTHWTRRPIDEVRRGPVALPAMGLGVCNAVFVEDVVQAALLAADRPEGVGEMFLISGAAPVTWLDFYAALSRRVGGHAPVPMASEDVEAASLARYGAHPLLAKLRRRFERADGRMVIPDAGARALFASHCAIDIGKARRLLGYAPAFDLARGMAEIAG